MDAIESGIVKVPRTPVDDDADDQLVTYLQLWDHIGDQAARSAPRKTHVDRTGFRRRSWKARCAACTAATRRRSSTGRRSWQQLRRDAAGLHRRLPEHRRQQARLRLDRRRAIIEDDGESSPTSRATLSCSAMWSTGKPLARPRTILIDSAQLESGEAIKDDFKKAAGRRDRRVQSGVPPPQPWCRRRQDHRRGSSPRSDEHGWEEGQAR